MSLKSHLFFDASTLLLSYYCHVIRLDYGRLAQMTFDLSVIYVINDDFKHFLGSCRWPIQLYLVLTVKS